MSFPMLLPPPEAETMERYLDGSAQPPRAIGSDWLVSPRMRTLLEDLRLINLEVIPKSAAQGLPLLNAQALRVVDSFQDLCRSSLRAGLASFCDLRGPSMAQFRGSTLMHLAQAEARLAVAPGEGPQRALVLAEEFEDIEAIVHLAAASDPARLDNLLARSDTFRTVALEQFLRAKSLQPFFFRTLERLNVPDALRDKLLEPYPELQWTLDVHAIKGTSTESDQTSIFEVVQRKTAAMAQRERHSAAKRETFAALSTLARFAAGGGEEAEDMVVADLACIGRLRRACYHFGDEVAVGSKRPSSDGPPNSAEECLLMLVHHLDIMRVPLGTLRAEKREGQMFQDAARLVRLVERGLVDRGADVQALLQSVRRDPTEHSEQLEGFSSSSGSDAIVIWALKKLWRNFIIADKNEWEEINQAAEGAVRNRLIANTGFYQMLAWSISTGLAGWRPPRSADLAMLCDTFQADLQRLAPALRLAENEAGATVGNIKGGITLTTSGAGA